MDKRVSERSSVIGSFLEIAEQDYEIYTCAFNVSAKSYERKKHRYKYTVTIVITAHVIGKSVPSAVYRLLFLQK